MITRRSLFTALAGLVGAPVVAPAIAREMQHAHLREIGRQAALRMAGEEAYRSVIAGVPRLLPAWAKPSNGICRLGDQIRFEGGPIDTLSEDSIYEEAFTGGGQVG